MSQIVKIKKGANIKLKGAAEVVLGTAAHPETFAVKPTDFSGLIPKMVVKAGDEVKAGTVLFYDKYNEQIKFVSPVSGEVVEVVRGEKRKILEVKILADKEIKYENFGKQDIGKLTGEEIKKSLLGAGLWPLIKQRPFDIIANPDRVPKSIFISAFDSSPLAPDYDYILHGNGEEFQAGLDALARLTPGKVHLNVNAALPASKVFTNSKNVQINKVSGPHPAGNVGIQIHHIDPINKGETVWVVNPQDVQLIGRFFTTGKTDFSKVVALTGSQVVKPRYYKVIAGTSIKNIIADNIIEGENNRYISGNPLTGNMITKNGHLGFYASQITVLPEGNEFRFLGWIAPNLDKLSLSKAYFSWLTPNKEYELNTNLNGEHRAFVVTGQYEDFLPMDIHPVHLIKAIMVNDIDAMENLGIYEVAPEDMALCEFACTSKINVQEILREGLDLVKKECD